MPCSTDKHSCNISVIRSCLYPFLDWGYNKTHVQLIYHNKTFGDVNLFYNPMPSQGWFLDQLSDRAERL
jgi:hypothetical protein